MQTGMSTRRPTVAGQFYPDSDRDCRSEVEAYLSAAERLPQNEPAYDESTESRNAVAAGSKQWIGGIVPHAGWVCSGAVAAEVIGKLCRQPGIDTVVVFGASHRFISNKAAMYSQGAWSTPLGEITIDDQLAAAILDASKDVEDNPDAHQPEHSIEVQVPFIQQVCPSARLLPLLVPHLAPASAIGEAVAAQAQLLNRQVVFLGSTDLTHYGLRYDFVPKGMGSAGLAWAKTDNDRRLIELVCQMQADRIVPEAKQRQNACGPGAVAATIAACRRLGATRGILLRHTTSAEVLLDSYGPMDGAVGYAGIVFSR